MEKNLAVFGDKVVLLSKQLRSSSLNLSNIPYLVKQIIEEEMWKKFEHPSASQLVDNTKTSFIDFVGSQPPRGLGSDLKTLENILLVQTRSSSEEDSQTAIQALDQFAHEITVSGGDPNFDPLPESIVDTMHDIIMNKPTQGKTNTYALHRLKHNRPDLHERVIQGELSTNKAMIEAGFRKRRFSIPQDDVESAASAIRKKLSEEQIDELIQALRHITDH